MTDDDNPEQRQCVREACMAVHVVLEREMASALDIVLLVRPRGTERSYFCTNTTDAEDMMRGLLKHLPKATAELIKSELAQRRRPN